MTHDNKTSYRRECNQLHHYCKFGNFRDNFIFANSMKKHICDVKKSRLGHNLPSSVFAILRGY